jgi:putative transposase
VRQRHPSWGPRKVKAWLEDRDPERTWPAASTIGTLFDRAGLTRPRKRRRRTVPQSTPLAVCREPNDVWCADFKGWFLTGDGTQVEPFTLSDGHSRFLIRCKAVGRADEPHVWPILAAAFCEYGLPRVLRSDNGPPFASLAVAGLSRLAVKLLKAGVLPERIAPGKPQQNGRHERLHLTLKQETAAPPAPSLAAQIARFERFRHLYNERPHEALGQVPPARLYEPSPRAFDGVLRATRVSRAGPGPARPPLRRDQVARRGGLHQPGPHRRAGRPVPDRRRCLAGQVRPDPTPNPP